MMRDDGPQADHQMITAFFDRKEDAERAVERLEAEGIRQHDIQMVAGRNPEGSTQQQTDDDKGFLETLKDWFMPDSDRESYSEGLRRGGYVVRVDIDRARRDRVFDILDDEGTVDMDERETEWRSQGWGDSTQSEAMGGAGHRDTDHGRKRVRSYSVEDDRGMTERDADETKPRDPSSTA